MTISRFISFFFLTFSILIFIFIFYRSEIQYSGVFFGYYLKYYLVTIFFIGLSILSFFINKTFKIQITITIFLTLFGFYIWEGYLIINYGNKMKQNFVTDEKIKSYKDKTGNEYDIRSKIQAFRDLKKLNNNATIPIFPSEWINGDKKDIFPFAGKSNSQTLDCNENGYYSTFQSDRFGFNNIDDNWEKNKIEYILIGDSFAFGQCVNQENIISSKLKLLTENDNGVLNLGYPSTSILIQYATLKEYFPKKKVKNILYFFQEANDLKGLSTELSDEILIKYIKQPNFRQELIKKQNEINKLVEKKIMDAYQKKEEEEEDHLNLIKFIKLTNFRELYINNYYQPNIKEFTTTLKLLKKFSEEKNSKLYFIYAPEYYRYIGINSEKLYDREKIIKIVKSLDISLIDLNQSVNEKILNPLELFPFGKFGHMNEFGYDFVAKTIHEKLSN